MSANRQSQPSKPTVKANRQSQPSKPTRFTVGAVLIILSMTAGTLFAEPDNQPFEAYAKSIALPYLAEVAKRRRLNTMFNNEQSPFYGVQISYTNVSKGNLTFLYRDLVRLDRMPIVFGRVYDSRLTAGDDFGPGWKLTVAEHAVRDGNRILYTDASNSTYRLRIEEGRIYSDYPHLSGITAGRLTDAGLEIEHLHLSKRFTQIGNRYQLTSVVDAFGNSIRLYYSQGLVEKIQSSHNRSVRITRNPAGTIASATDDSGRTVSFAYQSGRLSHFTDVGGNQWRYAYDGNGQLVSVTDPRGIKALRAGYNAGQVVSIQSQNNERVFHYAKGRTSVRNALQQEATFWQHDSGLTATARDFAGAVTQLDFDERLDARSLSFAGKTIASVDYENHRPVLIDRVFDTGVQTYRLAYRNSQLETVSLQGTVIANYQYGEHGQVLTALDANGKRQYETLEDGRLDAVTVDDTVVEFQPNPIGDISGIWRDRDNLIRFKRNQRDQISALQTRLSDQPTIYSYAYNALGFRQNGAYAEIGGVDFSYDAIGNMREVKLNSVSRGHLIDQYHVGTGNELNTVYAGAGDDISFTYDVAGRVVRIEQANRVAGISYDDLGRLTTVTLNGAQLLSFEYSPMDIDAVTAADYKSNQTRIKQPLASHIFGSLESIAYTRTRGTPYAPFQCSVTPVLMDSELPRCSKTRRSPQGMARPCQGLQRWIGVSGQLPAGEL